MVPILKMRRFSCLLRLSLPPEMGEMAQIFISEIEWLKFVPLSFKGKRMLQNFMCIYIRSIIAVNLTSSSLDEYCYFDMLL